MVLGGIYVRADFWEHYSLAELNAKEWEALCDGCGQCCLVRTEGKGEVRVFNITCELFDAQQSRCRDYQHRFEQVPHCHPLTPSNVPLYTWLPETCAYRRLEQGRSLESWHPLITGNRQLMRKLGITVHPDAPLNSQVPRHKRHQHLIKVKNI